MTAQRIIEGNKLIAEFMGGNIRGNSTNEYVWSASMPEFYCNQMNANHHVSELKFHSSWDWLMPVVAKIEDLFFVTSIQYSQKYYWADIAKHPQLFHPNENSTYETVSVKSASSKITAVWLAVVEFIQKTKQP